MPERPKRYLQNEGAAKVVHACDAEWGRAMADLGVWTVDGSEPQRVSRSRVDLEEQLENWIASDALLLGDGLTIVGRQVHLEGGRLDLLAIDWQRRWVVVEVKRAQLYRGALAQALDYASSIAQMDGDELEKLLRPGLAALGAPNELSALVRRQLEVEKEEREVAVLLVGVGVDAGLERIADYLSGFGIPISIVSFDVFEPDGGPRLLIREVIEEEAQPQAAQSKYSIDAIRRRAKEAGVGTQFDSFVRMSEQAGLRIQPRKYAVRIAVPQDARYRLLYARPEDDGLAIGVSPDKFAEFFPPLTEDEVTRSVRMNNDGAVLSGAELDARLDQIETFLKEKLPSPDDGDDSE